MFDSQGAPRGEGGRVAGRGTGWLMNLLLPSPLPPALAKAAPYFICNKVSVLKKKKNYMIQQTHALFAACIPKPALFPDLFLSCVALGPASH